MHCHSTRSDGVNTPNEVIREAKRKKLDFLTLTDHDTIAPREFQDTLRNEWIGSCDSVEISARNYDLEKSLHLVSYARIFKDSLSEVLGRSLTWKQSMKWGQLESLFSRHSFAGSRQWFDSFMRNTLGREPETSNKYDMSRYLYSEWWNKGKMVSILGDLLQNNDIVARFYEECLKRWWKLYDIYWFEVDEYEPSVETTINEVVTKSGWVVSLAHPNVTFNENKWGIAEFERTIEDYIDKWLNGIEINTMASPQWVHTILQIREKYDLILTFGSDCHSIWYDGTDGKHASIGDINPLILDAEKELPSWISAFDQNFERFQSQLWI